jgi:mono/diheme cytochrome c family protein
MKSGVYLALTYAVLCFCLLTGCNVINSQQASDEQKIAAGRLVYLNQCSHCHQPEGQGYSQITPPLAGNPIVILDTPEPTIDIVLHGRGGMPGFEHSLTGEERAQVISYIRNAWGNHASTVTTGQAQ